MTWVRLADDFYDHPKVLAAGPLAGWLWIAGIAYANRYLTDGFLPSAAVRRLTDLEDPFRLAAKLVDVGLWELADGGYGIHDYATYQPTAEAVKTERERTAERVAEWRRRQKSNAVTSPSGNAVTNGRTNGAPGPARPGPLTVPDPAGDLSQTLPLRGKGSAGAGPISRDVVERLSRLPANVGAAAFHDAAEAALTDLGFLCDREVAVADRGDGHGGRIDLVAERGGERIAFELDRSTPRLKSIRKLALVRATARVVLLRTRFDGPTPAGLDAVIGMAAADDELTPPTPEDVAVWARALADVAGEMSPGNAEQVAALEPIGRAQDGSLRLRAPPGMSSPERFRNHVARALLDAGDAAGPRVVIVEA